jgi:hypothetical protein
VVAIVAAVLAMSIPDWSNRRQSVVLTILLLVLSIVGSAYASYEWGVATRNGHSSTTSGPITIDLALPVSHGIVTVSGASVCVDRLGAHVFIGNDGAVVLDKPERFALVDCDRQDLASAFPELQTP